MYPLTDSDANFIMLMVNGLMYVCMDYLLTDWILNTICFIS